MLSHFAKHKAIRSARFDALTIRQAPQVFTLPRDAGENDSRDGTLMAQITRDKLAWLAEFHVRRRAAIVSVSCRVILTDSTDLAQPHAGA